MSRKCDFCGKTAMTGNNVSHSNIHTKRKFQPNLQRVKALVDGAEKRLHACTRCIRSGKVIKAPVKKTDAEATA